MKLHQCLIGLLFLALSGQFGNATVPIDPEMLRGDCDNNTVVEISDIISIEEYLFGGGTSPSCLDAADVNDDGIIDLSDVIYLNAYLFQNGPPPPQPYPYCGKDQTEDDLDCGNSACE